MIIAAILLVSSITSFAQTEKGKFMIGGNFDFAKSEQSGIRATEFSFSPSVGYFIYNNLSVGIGLDYSLFKSSQYKGEFVAIIPFARYYFAKQDKLKFFGQAGLGLLSSNIKSRAADDGFVPNKINELTYHAGVGASYFFTKNVALEGVLQYKSIEYKKALGFNLGLKIHF